MDNSLYFSIFTINLSLSITPIRLLKVGEINKLKLEVSDKEIRRKCSWVSKRKCQDLPRPWRPFLDTASHLLEKVGGGPYYHKSPRSQHWLKNVPHKSYWALERKVTSSLNQRFAKKGGKGVQLTHSSHPGVIPLPQDKPLSLLCQHQSVTTFPPDFTYPMKHLQHTQRREKWPQSLTNANKQ